MTGIIVGVAGLVLTLVFGSYTRQWGHPLVGSCQAQKSSLARKKRIFFVLSFLMITGILD